MSARIYFGGCLTFVSFFFFNDTATTEIYTLSLHDALPIHPPEGPRSRFRALDRAWRVGLRSEEHTSELQSHVKLVCRLLLEKKKRSQSAHRPRWHDQSPPEPFPVSFVPLDIRPEYPLAPTETACSSNSREETTATPVRPALRLAPALAIPGSGSSRTCPALTHIAQRHQPNACLSWVSQYHRSPARHRCRRRAYPLEPAVPSPPARHPTPRLR